MVNVNGGRDWSAATKDCPEFLRSLTQVKYFSTNLITVRAHRGHPYLERSDRASFIDSRSIKKSSIFKRTSQKFQGLNKLNKLSDYCSLRTISTICSNLGACGRDRRRSERLQSNSRLCYDLLEGSDRLLCATASTAKSSCQNDEA